MPWIFLSLMLANAAYFGWEFMESSQPRARVTAVTAAQVGSPIVLLGESPLLQAPVNRAPPAPVADVPAAQGSALQCFDVGPFLAEAGMQSALSAFQGKHFVARVSLRNVKSVDYWVFIPAFTVRQKAEEKLRDIKSRGVDGFVMAEGAFANAISLNHFSKKELAQAFSEKMRLAGISVESRSVQKNDAEKWIYVAPGQAKSDLRSFIDGQLLKHHDLKRENAPCEE